MNEQERKQQGPREPPSAGAPSDRPAQDLRRPQHGSGADKRRSAPLEGGREPHARDQAPEHSLASGAMKGRPTSDRASSPAVTTDLESDELLSDASDPLQRARGPRSGGGDRSR